MFAPMAMKAQAYQISNALRFRASNSAHLTRTPASTTNRRTFTWSGWVKRGSLGSVQNLLMVNSGTSTDGNWFALIFNSTDVLAVGGWVTTWRTSNAAFRDPSAWLHVVLAVDTTNATAGNRVRLWVNGVELTSFSTSNNPTLNSDLAVNDSAAVHTIGRRRDTTNEYFDGYMAEVNFIDGQALTPSSFGQTDPATGAWVPKKYTGTYGTNGFYLPFNDATSTTTISQDRSGNGNNWTSSGISVTSGVTFDQSTDTPTSNFCTWSPLKQSGSGLAALSAANLRFNGSSGESVIGTQGMSSGKWYWEIVYSTLGTTPDVGIIQLPGNMSSYPAGQKHYLYRSDGNKRSDGPGPVAYAATWTTGDVIGTAFDADAGSITFYKNNVSQGVAFSGIAASEYPFFPGASVNASTGDVNFGQRPFVYTPPTGFVALNTKNLPTPPIKRGDDGFAVLTRAGSNSPVTVTGLRFAPDFVWTKSRNTADHHNVADKVRGTSLNLQTSNSNAEDTLGILTAFNSDGYTLGGAFGRTNAAGQNFVDWVAREGAAYGFDIVTYTGNGANRTISHALGAVPHLMIGKRRDGSASWTVYHRNMNGTPAAGFLLLNTTSAYSASSSIWNSTAPTSSVFSLGTDINLNTSGALGVMYLWTSIPGFSHFGPYTGNGSSDGPFVWCGFRPRFVMIKRVDSTGGWWMVDTARFPNNQITNAALTANSSAAEGGSGYGLDILSNGFKPRDVGSDYNASGGTYIFAAFAETPFKYANAR
jgi:hypothetical protein